MSIEELCALPVADLAAEDSALFLWATFPQLPEALRLIKAWGFSYKTAAFVWLKLNKKSYTWFYGLGSKLYAVLCFIPPCVPAHCFLPCEKLYPGNVAHKGNDFFPRYVRLFAVLLYGGNNELMYSRRFSLWVSPCGK